MTRLDEKQSQRKSGLISAKTTERGHMQMRSRTHEAEISRFFFSGGTVETHSFHGTDTNLTMCH